jgi:death-on-curing protein
MKSFSEEMILRLHKHLINANGGLHGIKNYGYFKSAIETPFATFGGEELYKTIIEKISVMTFLLIQNHPMNDGNKRLGISIMLSLCVKNDINLKYSQQELIDLGLGTAKGNCDKECIEIWIKEHY